VAPYIWCTNFGHHIAGLADEYYTWDVAYLPATDGGAVERTVTGCSIRGAEWKDLVTPGTPLPTSWPKEEFERYTRRFSRAARDPSGEQARSKWMRLSRGEAHDTALLTRDRTPKSRRVRRRELRAARRVPAAGRRIMFTQTTSFCVVCRRAIDQILDLYSR